MKEYIYGLLSGFLIALACSIIPVFDEKFLSGYDSIIPTPSQVSEKTSTQADERVAQLLRENIELKKILASDANSSLPEELKQELVPSTSSQNASVDTPTLFAIQTELREIEDMTRYSGGVGIAGAVDTAFKAEEIDMAWADQAEENIQDFFRNDSSFINYVPDLIECRSTRCKVSLTIANKDEMDAASQLILSAIDKNSKGIAKKTMVTMDSSSGGLHFYIAKNESIKLYQ